jgi:hypothetical protein
MADPMGARQWRADENEPCDPINGSAENEIFAGRRWVSGTERGTVGWAALEEASRVIKSWDQTVKTWAVDGNAFESDRILL